MVLSHNGNVNKTELICYLGAIGLCTYALIAGGKDATAIGTVGCMCFLVGSEISQPYSISSGCLGYESLERMSFNKFKGYDMSA